MLICYFERAEAEQNLWTHQGGNSKVRNRLVFYSNFKAIDFLGEYYPVVEQSIFVKTKLFAGLKKIIAWVFFFYPGYGSVLGFVRVLAVFHLFA